MASDATVYPPGMPAVSGTDAIRKTFTEMTGTPGFALSWTPTRADVAASGDLGTTIGTYEMSMAGSSEKGKYVTVWRKQTDGSWKVVDDIFNADAPTQPPAGEHVMLESGALKWADASPTLPRCGGDAALLPVQIRIHSSGTGMGPFVVNYVNPADDPSKQP
jgi:ketosteroid isomerase-like protein